MTPKEDFEKAKKILQEELEGMEKLTTDFFSLFNSTLSAFDSSSVWSFLFELVQNAVDAKAENISFSLDENDKLNFQHDGKEPLTENDVIGLCGFSLSNKGLETVGFMGLGFKSFTRFFERVEISDEGIRFSIEAPWVEGLQPDLKKLYQPEWLDQEPTRKPGMLTRFTFTKPRPNTIESLKSADENLESTSLAVFGRRGLKTITFLEYKITIDEIDNSENLFRVGMVGEDDDGDEYHHLIFEKERNLSKDAIKQLKARRSLLLDQEAKKTTELKRKVRLLKEVDYTTDEQDPSVLIPKPMNKGKMFCLVRLGDNFPFPFKIGIDTDWILKGTTRESLETQDLAGDWHRELLEMVPELIRDYLDSMPNQTNPENRKRWLDVFPDPNSREVHLGLEFLGTDDFKELMKKSLSDCKFVLCADGETRSPTDVSDMPKNPGMTDSAYAEFTQDCFDCPILDTDSLEPSTLRYLKWLGFLTFPKEEDINVLSIQGLWDPNPNSSIKNYKHILDILYKITPKEDDDGGQLTGVALGPRVVPTSRDDEWGRLVDPELAFIAIPKGRDTLEAPLRRLLVENHPEFKEAKELHQILRVLIKSKEPGYNWKLNAKKTAINVIEKLRNLTVPIDEEHVLAKYRYALRGKLPSVVTHLHTVGGCRPVGKCLIGPPLGHELMKQIAPDQILSERMVNVPNFSRKRVLKFLENAGAVSLVPTEITDEVPITKATEFAGTQPPISSVAGSRKEEGLPRGYTTHDSAWPLKLSEISDQDALSDYLSTPDERLREAIKNASRRCKLTYFRRGAKYHLSTFNTTWITDLRELAWVRCVDDELRKPIDTALAHGAKKRDEHAILDEDVIGFYTKHGIAFGEDVPKRHDERLEFWRSNLASRNPQQFSETLRELANPDNYWDDRMDIPGELGPVLWWTKSGSAPPREVHPESKQRVWGVCWTVGFDS